MEIFRSIEGEGVLVGTPMTFIRLEGCNLRCPWCDTKYSYDGKSYKLMSITEIENRVKTLGLKNITITGGEPLVNDGFEELISLLSDSYFVKVETNGTIYSESLNRNLHITCSPKEPYFIHKKIIPLIDELKFVIDNQITLQNILDVIKQTSTTNIILQPQSYDLNNSITKTRNMQNSLIEKGVYVRLIPQIHKFLNLE